MSLKNVTVEEQCSTATDFLASPISKYITISVNIYGYSGTAEELIVNCISPLFLKSKATTGKEDNNN